MINNSKITNSIPVELIGKVVRIYHNGKIAGEAKLLDQQDGILKADVNLFEGYSLEGFWLNFGTVSSTSTVAPYATRPDYFFTVSESVEYFLGMHKEGFTAFLLTA